MKLLFDESLSHKLAKNLTQLYPGSGHVSAADLLQSSDLAIWHYAKANGFIIITTDADFFDLAAKHGPPPKVIWLRRWAHPNRDAEALLRRQAVRITEFAADPEVAILALSKEM